MNKFSFKAEGDTYPKNLLQHEGTVVVRFKSENATNWRFTDVRYFLKHWPEWSGVESYDLIYDKES